MKATEGNGGAPIVLQKGEVEKPDIRRGEVWIRPGEGDFIHEDGTTTFVVQEPGFAVTYHRVISVGSTECDELIMDVRPDTVVTWERRA